MKGFCEQLGLPEGHVFVIGEAGSNWRMGTPERDLKMGFELIDVAVDAGCDAVKFQVYRPETVYVPNAGGSDYLAQNGISESITDIFRDLSMPYEMIPQLAERCRDRGIVFMASAFSVRDAGQVDPHTPVHKVASYEISHVRLLEYLASTGKPLILSTGACDPEDIEIALKCLGDAGGGGVCLMQCTASYPAEVASLNLLALSTLAEQFGLPVGLSDHSRDPVLAPVMAVALGARVIEKHYTLSNLLPGPDHAFAVEPAELKTMVAAIRQAEQARGSGVKEVLPAERELRFYARRGLQVTCRVEPGAVLEEGVNFDILRPGKQRLGIHPRMIEHVGGRRATRRIEIGDGIQEGDYE
ncbi:MAG: N-acylneuraminate-9-phosphate synthase [bacterium]|nr:N-acylneuraminate-9-phosphate synthase [bacterium]